jgi:hypothetical protein
MYFSSAAAIHLLLYAHAVFAILSLLKEHLCSNTRFMQLLVFRKIPGGGELLIANITLIWLLS